MARNRVIYQSEGLYVSKEYNSTGSGDHFQLKRVQSANYNFNIARQDVNQYGQLARIDSIVLETPTVGLDFTYYVTDGKNEGALGFYVQTGGASAGQFPSGHVQDGTGRNFYIVTTNEGSDLNAETGAAGLSGKSAIGIGNAYLTNYTLDLAVGSIPTASVSFEGSNMNAFTFSGGNSGSGAGIIPQSGTSVDRPAFLKNPSNQIVSGEEGSNVISALRPGDVTISFGGFAATGSGVGGFTKLGDEELHVQSVSLALPLGRTPIQQLGTKFAFARTVDFPIVSTLTVNGIQAETSRGSLVDLIEQNPKNDITISIKKPGTTNEVAVRYTITQAQLDSIGFSSSIGSNKTVDLTFSTQIGGANDAVNGIRVSGSYTGAPF
jgi:hypothetical protein